MSEKSVRETICSSCTHRQVCAHKDDYLRMVSALQETFNRFPEESRSHIGFLDPDCKFVEKKEVNAISFRQPETNIDPEEVAHILAEGRQCYDDMVKGGSLI